MNENGQEKKPSVFKQSFEEVKAYFKGFRFDKPHLKAALPFFLEMLFFAFIITLDLTLKDYLYKLVVEQHGGNMTVIGGFFDLTYSENTGMGFGMGSDSTLGITIMTFIIVIAVICYLLVFRKDKPYIRIPLVMVAAGGIGNLVDRIAFGYVRDFFEFTFMDFAIFNVADSFITVGAIALIIGLIVMMATTTADEKKKAQAAAEAGAEATEGAGEAPRGEDSVDKTAEESSEATEKETASEESVVGGNAPAESEGVSDGSPRADGDVAEKGKTAFSVEPEGDDGDDGKDGGAPPCNPTAVDGRDGR